MKDASDNLPLSVDQGLIPLESRSDFPTSRALKSPQNKHDGVCSLRSALPPGMSTLRIASSNA